MLLTAFVGEPPHPTAASGPRAEMCKTESICRIEGIPYTYMHTTYCMYAMSHAGMNMAYMQYVMCMYVYGLPLPLQMPSIQLQTRNTN